MRGRKAMRGVRMDLHEIGVLIHEAMPHDGDGTRLGEINERTLEIRINPKQPRVGKHVTLLHELLHLVDLKMRMEGITKRRVSHAWIENTACNLLLVMVLAGVYRGVSRAEMLRFMRDYVPEGGSRKRAAKGGSR